jgi:hypothetical protein
VQQILEPGLSRRWVRRLFWLFAPSLACLCSISFASKALAIPALTPVPGLPFATPEPSHSKLFAFSLGPNLDQRHDNRFTISHVTVRTDGSLSLVVTVPGPGRLDMMETAWNDNLARLALLQPAPHRFVFARARTQATSAGKLRVFVTPTARGRLLVHHHAYRVTLRLWVTYTPIGGGARTDAVYGLHLTGAAQITPELDSVIDGQGVDLLTTFAFNARANPSFTKVHGSITLTGFVNLHGVLTCAAVAHNRGTAGYRIVSGQDAGQGFIAAAQAGTDSSGGRILWYDFLAKAPSKCPPSSPQPDGAVTGAPISSGYITLRRVPTGRYHVEPR